MKFIIILFSLLFRFILANQNDYHDLGIMIMRENECSQTNKQTEIMFQSLQTKNRFHNKHLDFVHIQNRLRISFLSFLFNFGYIFVRN